jgi:histidinol-phosphatase (PHP family)
MSTHPTIYDMHIHTAFSPDSSTPLEAYAQAAEELSIHIGFLDHFELNLLDRPDYLNFQTLPQLCEAFDLVHQQYPQTSLGLEVDFYSDSQSVVSEFCDDYRKEFHYLIGTVHTVDGLAVSIKEEMDVLVNRFGLSTVVQRYFEEVKGAIQSGLFNGIAHIDGVMRFVPLYPSNEELHEFWQQRTLELGRLCQKYNVPIEINLRGKNHPWGQMHPSQSLIDKLVLSGAQFYVGSDSHSLQDFKDSVPQVKQLHEYLREHGGLTLPVSL